MFNKHEKKAVEEQLTTSSNTIGKGTSLVGDIETFGNIRIDGKVKGNITSKSKLVLGDSSFIDGNVLAQNAEIEGEVTGRVEVTELLILKPSARIKGDIITNKMVVEAGAVFNGSCQMGADAKEIKITDFDHAPGREEARKVRKSEEPEAKSA
ncbi:bactofilin family protein [Nafulsella turpanensis]|uniref:bactofilin family protein n=1 Tax=Nafulsella turpanensis TaxID=1265690 RepID=UPI00034D167D|nr:polymer-forming cytoskeletal protein [Nafulsella turpanensis]